MVDSIPGPAAGPNSILLVAIRYLVVEGIAKRASSGVSRSSSRESLEE